MNENMGIAHKIASIYYPDIGDREDIIQDMMYQLWKAYPGFGGRSKFSTWMYRVCLNTVLSFKRKETRRVAAFFCTIPGRNCCS
jgi:RNA polymerase sigma-70 factor (ECF subfamily)